MTLIGHERGSRASETPDLCYAHPMRSPFSSRVADLPTENRLTEVIARVRSSAGRIIDLTVSNPTVVGIDYPTDEIAAALARGAHEQYEPDPRGIPSARRAVADHLGCDRDDIVITASTSEAYSFLFKLLSDPGCEILTPRPAYPLLEHLASIEASVLRQFPLVREPGVGWSIDTNALQDCLTDLTRAIVLVHPNNPTGSFVRSAEACEIADICRERGIALVSDEVFLAYPLEAAAPPSSLGGLELPCLTFTLGGLSKLGGMPHLKLAWVRVSGPDELKRQALARLDLIADNFLSVSTPVQAAVGELFEISEVTRKRITARTTENLQTLRHTLRDHPHVECLPVEGGWSAVLRVPSVIADEDLAIRILENAHVLVHPGHFFDFDSEGFLVVSLLGERFGEGVEAMLPVIRELVSY